MPLLSSRVRWSLDGVRRSLDAQFAVLLGVARAGDLPVLARSGSATRWLSDSVFAPPGSSLGAAAAGKVHRRFPSLLLMARPGSGHRATRVGPSLVVPLPDREVAQALLLARHSADPRFDERQVADTDPLTRAVADVARVRAAGPPEATERLRLLPVAASVEEAGQFTRDVVCGWGLSPALGRDGEHLVRSLVDGQIARARTTLDLALDLSPAALTVRVADHADTGRAAEPAETAESLAALGECVERLAAAWGFDRRPDGHELWAMLVRDPHA